MTTKPAWITINLPWNFHDLDGRPNPPDLSAEIVNHFGYDADDLGKKYFPGDFEIFEHPIWLRFQEIQDSLLNLEPEVQAETLAKSTEPAVKTMLEFRAKRNEIYAWTEANPAYIQFVAALDVHTANEKFHSFCGRGLNKPGTCIKTSEDKIYLIGDINTLGGVCDDCADVRAETFIKEYKVLTFE